MVARARSSPALGPDAGRPAPARHETTKRVTARPDRPASCAYSKGGTAITRAPRYRTSHKNVVRPPARAATADGVRRAWGSRHVSVLAAASDPPLFTMLDATLTGLAALVASVGTILTMKVRARRDRAEDRTAQARILAEERAANTATTQAIIDQLQEERKSKDDQLNKEARRLPRRTREVRAADRPVLGARKPSPASMSMRCRTTSGSARTLAAEPAGGIRPLIERKPTWL